MSQPRSLSNQTPTRCEECNTTLVASGPTGHGLRCPTCKEDTHVKCEYFSTCGNYVEQGAGVQSQLIDNDEWYFVCDSCSGA